MSDALKRLIESVEKGTAATPRRKGAHDMELFFDAFPPHLVEHEYQWAYDAFKGSLDAAKALHDALLPDWIAEMRINQTGYHASAAVWYYGGAPIEASSNPPARAWLLAILRAYQQVQA